mgnify:CR=1 FL=1
MSSSRTIDLDMLLQPIADDHPAGADPRESDQLADPYFELKDARADARSAERRALETVEDLAEASSALHAVVSDWEALCYQAQQFLTDSTKDLHVAAMFTEALARSKGFAGLRDGFELMTGLVREFWDTITPPASDEGFRDTVDPIAQLNGIESEGPLVHHIRKVPLTDQRVGEYAFWHQRMAETGSASFTTGEIENALRRLTPGELLERYTAIQEASAAAAELDRVLTETCGGDAPSLARIIEELDAIEAFVRRTVGDRLVTGPPETGSEFAAGHDAAAPGDAPGASAPAGPAVPSQIRSRQDALDTLQRVAAFFRETEPHSPMSFALEEIVRRGRLSFPDLLRELIPDENSRWDVLQRIGISPDQYEPSDSEA